MKMKSTEWKDKISIKKLLAILLIMCVLSNVCYKTVSAKSNGKNTFCGKYENSGYFLNIKKTGKTYHASVGINQIFSIDNLKGKEKKEVLTLKGKTYSGDRIVMVIKKAGKGLMVSFEKGSTDYFKTGTKIRF